MRAGRQVQMELLAETAPPFVRSSPTSASAATAIAPASPTLRAQVLAFVRRRGALGATDEEIQVGLRMNPSTERPRRVELCAAALLEDSGQRRKTRAGRMAVVWRAK